MEEIPNNHLGCIKIPVNSEKKLYTNLNWFSRSDFNHSTEYVFVGGFYARKLGKLDSHEVSTGIARVDMPATWKSLASPKLWGMPVVPKTPQNLKESSFLGNTKMYSPKNHGYHGI